MKLMSNERILHETKSGSLVITTHRIRSQTESVGYAQIKSIMLEELCSIAMRRTSNPILLVLAAISFVLSLLVSAGAREPGVLILGILAAGIFVAMYFGTRKQILSFA